MRLVEAGCSDGEVAARTAIPKETIRTWRRGQIPARGRDALRGALRCDQCGGPAHDFARLPAAAYTYLLAMYLGDGCLYRNTGGVYSLRVTLDSQYPAIVTECREAIAQVRGRIPHVAERRDQRCVVVTSYWKQWGCLLPHHGPGRKHDRLIELQAWQRVLVEAAPQELLRGLIHTDGWRGLNRVHVKGRDYSYPRYQFSNRSDDIRRLFTETCDLVGVAWRPWGRFHISVARRESVAVLDGFIGPKR